MIVYIVTVGQYSDYHIEAVFLDEEKSRAYVERFNASPEASRGYDAQIEEWEADECAEMAVRTVWRRFIDLSTGEVFAVNQRYYLPSVSEEFTLPRFAKVSEAHPHEGRRAVIYVEAAGSLDRCEKLAVEARQAYLRNEKFDIGLWERGE